MAKMPLASTLKDPETILGELLNLSVNNKSAQQVFNAYNLDGAFEDNLATLHQLSEKPLEAAAELLGAAPKVGGKKRYKNRTTLSEWIIMRISALFPYECGACGEEYQVERLASPTRRCHQCGQGSHDCKTFLESIKASVGTSPIGTAWLCHPCFSKNRLEAFPGYDGTADENSDDEFERKISPAQNKKGKKKPKKSNPGDDTTTPVSENPIQDGRSLKLDLRVVEEAEDTGKTPIEKFENVCEAYKKKSCPHGRKGDQLVAGVPCSKNHPPICTRFVSHGTIRRVGCSKGKECTRYHPPICRGSEMKRECFDQKCDRIHLKFTKRTREAGTGNQPRDKSSGKDVAKKQGKRKEKKPKDIPQEEPSNNNNTKTGLVDQDFLLSALGTLREGMMQELLVAMDQRVQDQLEEFRVSLSPPGALERFRQKSSPPLPASPSSTPKSKGWTYGDIVKRYPGSFCSTPAV